MSSAKSLESRLASPAQPLHAVLRHSMWTTKTFAMISSSHGFVVKLPTSRVDVLVECRDFWIQAQRLRAGVDVTMNNERVLIVECAFDGWVELAREAQRRSPMCRRRTRRATFNTHRKIRLKQCVRAGDGSKRRSSLTRCPTSCNCRGACWRPRIIGRANLFFTLRRHRD